MALSSTTNKSGPYACNGSQTVFAYGFKVFDDDHLEVVLTDSAGAETILTKTTHYSVSGVGDESGGNVTTTTAYASGNTLLLRRKMPLTQEDTLSNQSRLLPSVVEAALDKIVMGLQQLSELLTRSLRAPVSDEAVDMTLPSKAIRASTYLGFDANGAPTAIAGAVSEVPVSSFMTPVLAAASAASAQSLLGLLGDETIFVPAAAMTPRTTNGAAAVTSETSTNKVMQAVMSFDQSTQEHVQFMIAMPTSWDEGVFDAEFIWTDAIGDGNVIWGIQAVAIGNADALDAAFGAAVEVTDTSNGSGDQSTTSATGDITPAGSAGVGDVVVFQVYRKAADGGDTLAGDASLLGVRLKYTTETVTD